MDMVRFGVYWVNLDPTVGSEMKKKRPVVVVSPKEMNDNLDTVLICPLTSTLRNYPTRVRVEIGEKKGDIAIDHMRSIDQSRIKNQLGMLSDQESDDLIQRIIELMKK